LALEFAKQALQKGYQLVVADGKSSKTFRKELSSIEGIIVIRRKSNSRGKAKRLCIDKAIKLPGVQVIVLVEPEKVSLVTHCMEQMVLPLLQKKADIVVPKRQDELFKSSYPRYMYDSEVEGNSIYNEALRSNGILPKDEKDLDIFFGPRAFRNEKDIVSLFKKRYKFIGESILGKLYDSDSYSNVLYFPIVNALKKKMRVMSVEVPFTYPQIQKENEDVGAKSVFIEKRSLQRVSILIDLMHFLSFMRKGKNAKIRNAN
jgi:hypothetical protein